MFPHTALAHLKRRGSLPISILLISLSAAALPCRRLVLRHLFALVITAALLATTSIGVFPTDLKGVLHMIQTLANMLVVGVYSNYLAGLALLPKGMVEIAMPRFSAETTL